MWPREVAEKTFIDYLWSQYDYTQLGAIEVSLLRHSAFSMIDCNGAQVGEHHQALTGRLWQSCIYDACN